MSDVATVATTGEPGLDRPFYSLSAFLYPGLETFNGQITTIPPLLSAKDEVKYTRRQAARAARHLERRNEHIAGGIDRKADMVVGGAIRVRPQPNWALLNDISGGALTQGDPQWKAQKDFAQACTRWFDDWANDPRRGNDSERAMPFGGQMWMAFRNYTGPDGETAGIIHTDPERAAAYGFRWSTHVQVLDPQRISTPPMRAGDKRCHDGVQLDNHGGMIGFWIERDPELDELAAENHVWCPRENRFGRPMSWLFFEKRRGGQVRGVSKLVSSVKHGTMLDGFDDYQLAAAAINAMLAPSIKTKSPTEAAKQALAPAAGPDGKAVDPMTLRMSAYRKLRMANQHQITLLLPDDEIDNVDLSRTIADPTNFRNNFLRQFAMALGLSFEQLSNNFSDANYSAARAALLEIWRGVVRERFLFTAATCQLVYSAVIEEAIAKGFIPLPAGAPPFVPNRAAYTAASWTGPGMGWIDPQKEMSAYEKGLGMKIITREEIAAMRGASITDVFDQLEQENRDAAERGLDLTLEPAAAAPAPAPADDPETPEEAAAAARETA